MRAVNYQTVFVTYTNWLCAVFGFLRAITDKVGAVDATALEGFTRIEVDLWLSTVMGAATRLESSAGMDVPVLKREVTFRKKKKKERIWVRKPHVMLRTAIYLPVLACL